MSQATVSHPVAPLSRRSQCRNRPAPDGTIDADHVGLVQPRYGEGVYIGSAIWRDNDSDLGDYAIHITSRSKCSANPNVVHASNTVANAREGLTNIPVTP